MSRKTLIGNCHEKYGLRTRNEVDQGRLSQIFVIVRIGGAGKVKSFLKILLFERGFRFTFWWRLASVNFTISQFCTIGSNKGHAATIGDNVYIAPHCCIVEDVKIGDNSTIGAGSVVTHDVPKNAIVAGVPAKIINYKNH